MSHDATHSDAPLSAPTGIVTEVLWDEVTGAQLEELLYGLLDAMGASSLVWRAGSATGVTAADGGRDLEAIFDRPSPDGELDRQRWWIECKGRTGTVERAAVQQALLDASARPDVDTLVVATNSRFSNPTRDWVEERTGSFPRPIVKLWDRDRLDRLVRRYPTVAARVLPNSLSDEDRLRLLVARFEELGEEPTALDIDYFWERRDWLGQQEPRLVTHAVAMLLYAEGVVLPRRRTWWLLLQEADAPDAIIMSLVSLPELLSEDSLPRPLETIRVLAAAGRMLIACLLILPDPIGIEWTLNPWRIIVGGDEISGDREKLEAWQKGVLRPVLAFAQSDLVDACSSDCLRVTAGNVHEIDSLLAKGFWGLLTSGDSGSSEGVIIIESTREPCTIGLDVSSGCPLVVSNELDIEEVVRGIRAVLRFRQAHPDDAAPQDLGELSGPGLVTFLLDGGLSWKIARLGEEGT